MDSVLENIVPQAGILNNEENPAIDSDRVKASVVNAGSTDFGGSQKHVVANQAGAIEVKRLASSASQKTSEEEEGEITHGKENAKIDRSAEKKKQDLLELVKRQDDLLFSLSEFLKGKTNVHKEIHRKVASLSTNWRRITELGGIAEAVNQPKKLSAANTQTTPTLNQKQPGCNVETMEGEETPKGRRAANAKKRKERCTPPSTEQQEKRRRKAPAQSPFSEPPPPGLENEGGARDPEGRWQKVRKKKRSRKMEQLKPPQPRKRPRGRPTLPNALVIEKKGDLSYAEILSRLKKDESLKDAGNCVQKVRRTNAGKLLIVLTKESSEKEAEVHQQIQGALGDLASVTSRVQETDIELKDIAEDTTEEEVFAAIQRELGADVDIAQTCVRSLRYAYDKTQTAAVRLTPSAAERLLNLKTIRIQWSSCRIREVVRPPKCFRCWDFGHLSRSCKSETDRSKCCIRCGENGHKAAECTAQPHCALCAGKGNESSVNHIAGSSRCPAYKRASQAFQATLKRRQ